MRKISLRGLDIKKIKKINFKDEKYVLVTDTQNIFVKKDSWGRVRNKIVKEKDHEELKYLTNKTQSATKIYFIRSTIDKKLVYVGSTNGRINKRTTEIGNKYRNWVYGGKLKRRIFKFMNFDEITSEFFEFFEGTREGLKKRLKEIKIEYNCVSLKLKQPITEKRCYKCKETKKLENFYRDKKRTGGRGGICIPCDKIRKQIYHEKNREEINRRRREKAFGKPLERFLCEICNYTVVKKGIRRHERSKRHKINMEKKNSFS